MTKLVFALLPIGAISDYLFNGAIYLHELREMFLTVMDQFSAMFLPV